MQRMIGGDYEALMRAADERGARKKVREQIVSGDLHAAAKRLRVRLP